MTIEQVTESKGASGRPVEAWTLLGKAWMQRLEVNRIAEAEHMVAGGLSARVDAAWVMSYQQNMDPEALNVPKLRRLRYESRIYDITSAAPIGLHDRIQLTTIAKA